MEPCISMQQGGDWPLWPEPFSGEANVQAYIDGFWITFYAAIVGVLVVSLMAPSPLHPLTKHPR